MIKSIVPEKDTELNTVLDSDSILDSNGFEPFLRYVTVNFGINFDILEDVNNFYFFKLLLTDEILEYLTKETNR